MEIFEKIIRFRSLLALDEPFYLNSLISDIRYDFKIKDENEVKEKFFEFIHYIINNDIFDFGIYENINFKKWDLSKEEIIEKINYYWENVKRFEHILLVDLSENGKNKTLFYLSQKHAIEEEIIKKCLNEIFISFKDVFDVIKKVFNTNDLEEIKFEAIDETVDLISYKIIEPGTFENNNFIINPYAPDMCRFPFERIMKNLNHYPKEGEIFWFRINPNAFELLEQWQKEGGNLIEFWRRNT